MKSNKKIMIYGLVTVAIILAGSAIGYGVAVLENLDIKNTKIDTNPTKDYFTIDEQSIDDSETIKIYILISGKWIIDGNISFNNESYIIEIGVGNEFGVPDSSYIISTSKYAVCNISDGSKIFKLLEIIDDDHVLIQVNESCLLLDGLENPLLISFDPTCFTPNPGELWFMNDFYLGTSLYLQIVENDSSLIQVIPHDDLDQRISWVIYNGGEFVINTQEEYQSLMKYKQDIIGFEDYKLPGIDLSQKTLLGKLVGGSGCTTEFNKTVYKDDINKKIIYVINVIEKGRCEPWRTSMNWILIPKIPSDYSVLFEVNRIQQDE